MSDSHQEFWECLDSRRGQGYQFNLSMLLNALDDVPGLHLDSGLLRQIYDRFGSHALGSFLSPPELVTFIAELAGMGPAKSVLDPVCGPGLLLLEVATKIDAEIVHGIEINAETAQLAARLLTPNGTVSAGDSLQIDHGINESYDLIVGEPPFGLLLQHPTPVHVDGEPMGGEFSHVLAYWASRRLSQHGRAIFILPASFLLLSKSKEARAAIHASNRAITTAIHVPRGSFQGTQIDAYIVVIEPGTQSEIFVGQFSADVKHQSILLGNLKRREAGNRPAQGRLCSLQDFRGFPSLEASERVERIGRSLGYTRTPLRELALSVRSTNQRGQNHLQPSPNSVYLRRTGRGAPTTSHDDVPTNATDYVQIEFDPNQADARFVAELFKRELGQLILDSIRKGSTVQRFTVNDLLDLDLFLPSMGAQAKMLQAFDRLAAIRAEIDDLDSSLWSPNCEVDQLMDRVDAINKEDSFEEWIETLPFPLASILWRRETASSHRDRFEILLHFFEAMAEFLATVHLSAFSSDRDFWADARPHLFQTLHKQGLALDRATFGTWKCVVECLASKCRKMLEKRATDCRYLYRTCSAAVVEMLTSKRTIQALQRANSIRNAWQGHGGVIDESRASQLEAELWPLVQDCRSVFGRRWLEFELVQPAECWICGGIFRHNVRRIVGTRTPFRAEQREYTEGLESGSLYLVEPNGDSGLRLLPFIRVMPSPRTETNACYFYNRRQGDRIRYVSYHFAEDSDVTEHFADTQHALEHLGLAHNKGDF